MAMGSGRPVQRLEFRSGAVLSGPASAHLGFLFGEIWIDRVYTPKGYEVQDGDVVIDVGANIGVFSLFAALVARDVEVFAYEPFSQNAALLRANVDGIRQSRVRVFEQAVGGRSGKRLLQAHPSNWIVHTLAEPGSTQAGMPVSCVSLDDLMAKNAIQRCNLLKLDCEGSEYEILGCASTETLMRFERIVGEYHPVPGDSSAISEDELCRLLRSRSFRVESLQPFTGGGGGVFHARNEVPPPPREHHSYTAIEQAKYRTYER